LVFQKLKNGLSFFGSVIGFLLTQKSFRLDAEFAQALFLGYEFAVAFWLTFFLRFL